MKGGIPSCIAVFRAFVCCRLSSPPAAAAAATAIVVNAPSNVEQLQRAVVLDGVFFEGVRVLKLPPRENQHHVGRLK